MTDPLVDSIRAAHMRNERRRQKTLALLIGAMLVYLIGRWEATAEPMDAEELGVGLHAKKNTVKFTDLKDYAAGQDAAPFVKALLPSCLVEQAKYKIPASIKLAQAILESNEGKSKLARTTNNLYGIKSFNKSERRSRHHDDVPTDYFKVFDTRWHSVRAHSHLLVKSARYAPLFADDFDADAFEKYRDLPGRNGKQVGTDPNFGKKLKALKANWHTPHLRFAYGLDVVGYATDNAYAATLIRVIKEHDLTRFDHIKVTDIP